MQIDAQLFEFCAENFAYQLFRILYLFIQFFLLTEKLVYFSTVHILFSICHKRSTLHGFSMANIYDIIVILSGIIHAYIIYNTFKLTLCAFSEC